jgi:hypothetical protein
MDKSTKDRVVLKLVELLYEDDNFFNAVIRYANSARKGCMDTGGGEF